MKKFILGMIASAALFCSCVKNPAESYLGQYQLKIQGTATIEQGDEISEMPIDQTIDLTISPVGEEGDVQLNSTYYNTTGFVDEEGVLHLDDEEVTIPVSPEIILKGKFIHKDVTQTSDGLSWTTNATATVESEGMALHGVFQNTGYKFMRE